MELRRKPRLSFVMDCLIGAGGGALAGGVALLLTDVFGAGLPEASDPSMALKHAVILYGRACLIGAILWLVATIVTMPVNRK